MGNVRLPNIDMNIVVVDSDSKTINRIDRALRAHIYECKLTITDSGRQSLDITKKDCPDLIVIGTELNDMSGFDLIKQIRRFSEVPIIFLLNEDDEPEVIVKASSMGIDRCMAKPISQPVFIAYVESLMRRISSSNQGRLNKWGGRLNRYEAYS
jgi:DNA-binding response OmpR family regulator